MYYYTFYDTNILEDCSEENDIRGNDYRNLLKICFKYSSSFSFMIAGEGFRTIENNLPRELEEYRIEAEDSVLNLYVRYKIAKDVRCYIACPQTYELILGVNDSIFSWINGRGNKKPEDLAFFREDGSVFFHSVTHDGECSLYPRNNEDIGSVLSTGKWYLRDSDKNTGDGSMCCGNMIFY